METTRRQSMNPKTVIVNPVDYLKFRDFSNKYCRGVQAINDIEEKSGHSPTVVQFLLTTLVGSKAARGATAEQITDALSSTYRIDGTTERQQLVDRALTQWSLLSTSGLGDVPVGSLETNRLCLFQSCFFVLHSKDVPPIKAEFQWLLCHRMGVKWCEVEDKTINYFKNWIQVVSKGLLVENFQAVSKQTCIFATSLQFKCKWAQPPELLSRSKSLFETAPRTKIHVPMLRLTTRALYLKDHKRCFHMVGIPLKKSRFVVAFILPLVAHQFKELEHRFQDGVFHSLFDRDRMKLVNMQVTLPKFKVKTEVDLCQALSLLGMMDPFDSDRANFSGINDAENLHLESGKEFGFLEVSKKGLELLSIATLALSTNVRQFKHPDLLDEDLQRPPQKSDVVEEETRSFVVNQPFGVVIVDRESKCVLYQARIKVPKISKMPLLM